MAGRVPLPLSCSCLGWRLNMPQFKVKPFAPAALSAPKTASHLWGILRNAMEKIFNHENAKLSFAELHWHTYKLVLDKQGDMVYNGMYEALLSHFSAKRMRVANEANGDFLATLQLVWLDTLEVLSAVKDIFMYMDRTYIVHMNKKPTFARSVVHAKSSLKSAWH